MLIEAYQALGSTIFHLGELGAAQVYMEQSLTLYDTQHHRSLVFLSGRESGVAGLSLTAFVLWHLGYPDQALQKSKAARTLAQELSHLFLVAAARVLAAMLHQLRRDRRTGVDVAREALQGADVPGPLLQHLKLPVKAVFLNAQRAFPETGEEAHQAGFAPPPGKHRAHRAHARTGIDYLTSRS